MKGETLHFAARGKYDGMLFLGDRESSSYWNLAGECIYGPLKGSQLERYPLLHMTASQALATNPGAQLAMSSLLQFRLRLYVNRLNKLLPHFLRKRISKRFFIAYKQRGS